MCVTCASPAVASVSLTLFYHSGRLPRSRLRLFRCATSPAMSLLSLTVVSHSLTFDCAAVGAEFAVPGVASGSRVVGVWLTGCLGLGWLLAFVVFTCCIYTIWSVCRCFCMCLPRATVTAVSATRRTLCPLHAYLRSYVSNGCCTYLCVPTPVRGVCLRTQAECGACNPYVRPVFVL
jgi:hypothetical protein